MKKVLSVLLAAAMVMGMSVTSFAADDYKTFGAGSGKNNADVSKIVWNHVIVVNEDGVVKDTYKPSEEILDIEDGDVFYFPVSTSDKAAKDGKTATEGKGFMIKEADSDWKIKLKGDEYVKSATFKHLKTDDGKASVSIGEKLYGELDTI